MDTKKLIHILLRDIVELDNLVIDIRQNGGYDALDMELLQTRIAGIRHILEIAGDSGKMEREIAIQPEKPKPVSLVTPENLFPPEKAPAQEKQVIKDTKKSIPQKEVKADRDVEPFATPPAVSDQLHEKISERIVPEMRPEEENPQSAEKQILAEKFVAGKSLNDLLLERSKSDLKFANMPLSNLTSAIGTNERFLFTRELFEGDMESFTATLQKLDSMNNVQEAAEYLRDNFKWKKSETSLRFIDLVKRRFTV
jgi:hypothetical protein